MPLPIDINPLTPAALRNTLARIQRDTTTLNVSQEDLDNYNTETATAAQAMSVGDLVYLPSAGNMDLADASGDSTATPVGMLIADVAAAALGRYRVVGEVENSGWTLTPGEKYFLSGVNPGKIVSTIDVSLDDEYVIMVGRAITATKFALNIHQRIRL